MTHAALLPISAKLPRAIKVAINKAVVAAIKHGREPEDLGEYWEDCVVCAAVEELSAEIQKELETKGKL